MNPVFADLPVSVFEVMSGLGQVKTSRLRPSSGYRVSWRSLTPLAFQSSSEAMNRAQ